MTRVAWAAFVILMPLAARAQSLDASLTGTVTDATGAALPGATITATERSRHHTRSTVADATGRYRLLNLPSGSYDVVATMQGLTSEVHRALPLHIGVVVNIDWTLDVASVSQDVTVHADGPVLETTKNTLSRIVQSIEIDAVPVIDRNFNNLAALAPGVTTTGAYGGVDISGARDYQNTYLVDGVTAERQRLGDQQIPFAQDWIQEFQVMTSQFPVEFGRAAGGVINVVTRSGTDANSGRLYGFFRNGAWDATPAFVTVKPPLHEHRFGATAGGPLVRSRVFYFAGVERLQTHSSSIVKSTFAAANGAFPAENQRTISMVKLDVLASAVHTFGFRFNGQRERTVGSSIGGISTEEHGRFQEVRADDMSARSTWVLSATKVNELRAAWNASTPRGGCNFAARNPPGTWFERNYPGAQFGCPVNFGTIAEHQVYIVDNLSWSSRAHDAKVGIQWVRTRSSGDFRNLRDGRYAFERDVPFSADDPVSYPFSFTIIDGATSWNVIGDAEGAFAEDSWRVNRRLTLNAGVRYDVDRSPSALNRLARLDKGMHTFATDMNNVAPRAGLAWTPSEGGRTLVRGGAGLYYDQHHDNVTSSLLLNNILVDRIISINANNASLNPFWPDIATAKRFLAEALARNTVPDISTLQGLAGSTNDVDHNLQIPRTAQLSAGVAHDFGERVSGSADVVYVRGDDLYIIRDVNLDRLTLKRINPNYTSILAFGNGGRSRYRALQMQLNVLPRRLQLLKVGYTLAGNRNNTNATLSAGTVTNPFDLREDEGAADNDVRHTLAVNGAVQLRYGVEVAGLLTYRSALPYSATINAPRPDGLPFTFRPEPRNSRRGDALTSIDLRVAKRIRAARVSSMLFAEAFNLTNAINYSDYVGTITSTAFGYPTKAAPKRRLQLGFRLEF